MRKRRLFGSERVAHRLPKPNLHGAQRYSLSHSMTMRLLAWIAIMSSGSVDGGEAVWRIGSDDDDVARTGDDFFPIDRHCRFARADDARF